MSGPSENVLPGTPPAAPCGILVVDKQVGFTSMDVCAIVRGRFRKGGAPKSMKVGHAGTLDPAATGVLVVLVGRATRLCDVLMAHEKEYEADIDLSRRSTTDDIEGELTSVPIGTVPTREQVERSLAGFVGTIMQVPPAFSAIKVGGKRAYASARAGKTVTLAARPVVIHELSLTAFDWPIARVHVRCGKGTYIRSLARDLGAALGVGGMLTALRRTRVGAYSIEQAKTLDALPHGLTQQELLPAPDKPTA